MSPTLLGFIPIIVIVGLIVMILKDRGQLNITNCILGAVVSIILISAILIPITSYDEKQDLDVFVVAGQSNAAYLHYNLELSEPNPQEDYAFFYGSDSGPIVYGSHSTPSYDTTLAAYTVQSYNGNLAHLEAPFSAKYSGLTGHKVLTINVGISATTIQEWQDSGFAWQYADKVIDNALSKIDEKYRPHLKGFIWIQGESNSSMSKEEYMSQFLNTYHLFEDKGFKDCFISKVRRDTTTSGQRNPIGPSDAQIELSETYEHIHLATQIADTFTIANGLMESDNLHYNQLGQNLVGVNVAEYCAQYFSN